MRWRMQWHPGPAIPSWVDALGRQWQLQGAGCTACGSSPCQDSPAPCPPPNLPPLILRPQGSPHPQVLSHPWAIPPAALLKPLLTLFSFLPLRLLMLSFNQQLYPAPCDFTLMQRHSFSYLSVLGSPSDPLEKSVQSNITATLPKRPKEGNVGFYSSFFWI